MLWLGPGGRRQSSWTWLVPGIPMLAQAAGGAGLVSIQVYRTWFLRETGPATSLALKPAHRRAGRRVLPLERAIVDGRGRADRGCLGRCWRELLAGSPCASSAATLMTLQVEPA